MKRDNHISPYYPIFLSLSGRKCVVVGGGPVALRKARALVEHKADVEIISPELCPELREMAEKGVLQVLPRNYNSGDLEGAFMAIAATDDSRINGKVAEEARRGGVLVNVVDDPEHSDFIVPSYLCRGAITIAISTSGKSPALARKMRARLEEEFGTEYASLALVIGEVRSEMKRQGIKIDGDTWQEAIDLDVLTRMLKAGPSQKEKVRAALLTNLERLGRTKV